MLTHHAFTFSQKQHNVLIDFIKQHQRGAGAGMAFGYDFATVPIVR